MGWLGKIQTGASLFSMFEYHRSSRAQQLELPFCSESSNPHAVCSPEKSLHTLGLSFLWRQGSLQHTLPGLTVQCKVDQQRGPLRGGRGQGVALALETVPLCLFLIGDTVIFLELGDLLGRKGEAFLGQEGGAHEPFCISGSSLPDPQDPRLSPEIPG